MSYKAGLIGFGRVGRNHAEAFIETPGIELHAIADVDENLLRELGDVWSIPQDRRYNHHSSMLSSESLDVVSVATPHQFHYENVLDVVNSQADPDIIWCEKPIATSVSRADEMVTACEENDIELVVNHSRNFATAHGSLFDLLHSKNIIGDIESVHVISNGSFLNAATHRVALVLYLLDTRVQCVTGGYTELTQHNGLTHCTGGGTFFTEHTTITFNHNTSGAPDRMYLYGTDGTISVPLDVGSKGQEWGYWELQDGDPTRAKLPEPLGEMWDEDISGTHSTYTPDMVPCQTLFEHTVEHIIQLLEGEASNRSSGAEALHGLEILVACYLSSQIQGQVSLPLDPPLRHVRWME